MTILLVDDHRVFRKSFGLLLERLIPQRLHCLEAGNGLEALDALSSSDVQLLFLDINMPGMNGIEAFKVLHKEYPRLPIIVLTNHDNEALVLRMVEMGAWSFLDKNVEICELEKAINLALKGERYFPKAIQSLLNESKVAVHPKSPTLELTTQEKALIKLLIEGKTSKEIACNLNLAVKTVTTYRERLLDKTQTTNVADLISFCFRTGMIG